nr:trypsin-like serine protease [Roseivivax halodurans]
MADTLLSLGSRQDGRNWDAVGRIEIADRSFCTGALIAPNLVLTAAHCLYDLGTGARVAPGDMQFRAGWRNGRAVAYRQVRRAVHLPDFVYGEPSGSGRVRHDVALLELDSPIDTGAAMPFRTDRRPRTGDEIGVVSYAYDRAEAPSVQERCRVISRQEGVLVMSCAVDFGSSGSPVFSFASGEARIVSVVAAKAQSEGRPVSLGIGLDGPVAALRAMLDAGRERPGAPDLTSVAAGTGRDSGATVVPR